GVWSPWFDHVHCAQDRGQGHSITCIVRRIELSIIRSPRRSTRCWVSRRCVRDRTVVNSGVLTETAARWMLVLHTALGVAAVGAAPHLVLWLRRVVRGELGRLRAARRFAWIVLTLQLAGFAAGNVMYPTYKVEVRSAYLENSVAIVADR